MATRQTITLDGQIESMAMRKLDDPLAKLTGNVLEIEAIAVTRNTERTGPNDKGLFIEPAGFDVSRFAKNARLYLDHGSGVLDVIGRVTQIDVNTQSIKVRADIPEFLDERRMAARLDIERGMVKALSVGFFIQEAEPVRRKSKRKAAEDEGDEEETIGLRVTKARLLEISIVYQGADEDALITRVKRIEREPVEDAIPDEQWLRTEGGDGGKEEEGVVRHTLKYAEATLAALRGPEPEPEAAAPEPTEQVATWKAIPYARHGDTPTAPADTKWDAAGIVGKADADTLAIICCFEDTADAESKGAYKGPHHLAEGKHAVVWNGVRALMGALLGARGGFKGITAAVLKSGYGHAAKHYKQFDKTPPEWRQYATEELVAMATAGRIIIAGMPVVNVEVQAVATEEPVEVEAKPAEPEVEAADGLSDLDEIHGELAAIRTEAARPVPVPPPSPGVDPAVIGELLQLDRDRRADMREAMTAAVEEIRMAAELMVRKTQAQVRRLQAQKRQRTWYDEDS